MSGQKLRERRGRPELRLHGPTPDVVLERTITGQHQFLRPSAMPRGVRSRDPTSVPVAGGEETGAVGVETQATLGYGDWAAASAPAVAPAPATDLPEVIFVEDDEEESLQASLPGVEATIETSPSQNLALAPAPVTPVGQMIPSQVATPATPFVSANPRSPAIPIAMDPNLPFLERWNAALDYLDTESAKIFIRACFYGGRAMMLSFVVRRQFVTGLAARRLMHDLRLIARAFSIASVTVDPRLSLDMISVNLNDIDEFTIKVSAEDSAILLTSLLGNQTFGQTQHSGKSLCSNACRCIVDLLRQKVADYNHRTPEFRWLEMDNILGVFQDNFRKHMPTQMAIFGNLPPDQDTVQLLARASNTCARWFLARRRWLEAKERAEKILDIIKVCSIAPPKWWQPREPRFVRDFDEDITEYKAVIYRRETMLAQRIISAAEAQRLPTREQFFHNIPQEGFYDFNDICDIDELRQGEDPGRVPALEDWLAADNIDDPARIIMPEPEDLI